MITAADFRDACVSTLFVGYDWDSSQHFVDLTLRYHGDAERTYRIEGLSSWSAFEDFSAQYIERCTLLTESDRVYLCLDPFQEGERSQQDNFWFVGSLIAENEAK